MVIKTTDFFAESIDKRLLDIHYIQDIANNFSKRLYAFYSFPYKIEFCFHKDCSPYYLMVEEMDNEREKLPYLCSFVDDVSIFHKTLTEIQTFWEVPYDGNKVQVGKVSLYFNGEKVESLYYFP